MQEIVSYLVLYDAWFCSFHFRGVEQKARHSKTEASIMMKDLWWPPLSPIPAMKSMEREDKVVATDILRRN